MTQRISVFKIASYARWSSSKFEGNWVTQSGIRCITFLLVHAHATWVWTQLVKRCSTSSTPSNFLQLSACADVMDNQEHDFSGQNRLIQPLQDNIPLQIFILIFNLWWWERWGSSDLFCSYRFHGAWMWGRVQIYIYVSKCFLSRM